MQSRLTHELRANFGPLAAMVAAELAAALLVIAQAVLLTRIIAGAFLQHADLRQLLPVVLVLAAVMVARSALLLAAEAAAVRLARRVKTDLRSRLFRHVAVLGPTYLKSEQTGELVNTAIEGAEQIEVYIARYLPQIILAAGVPVTLFCYIVTQDWITAVILCVTGPLIPFFMILIGRSAESVTKRQWDTLSVLSAHFLDVLRGLQTLRLFNRSKRQIDVMAAVNEAYRRATMKSLRIAFLSALVLELLATLSTAMVAVGLGLRLIDGRFAFAPALAVLLLTPEFFLPIRNLGTQFHAGLNGVSAAERIYAVLDEQPQGLVEQPDGKILAHACHEVRFESVSFAYGETEVLHDISFTLRSGQTVALVGPSGAGKSTIVNLLLGFIRPSSGQILIDGTPLPELSLRWWRGELAVVTQHTHLFAGTLADNVRMAEPNSPPAKWHAAAAKAGVDSFVDTLPKGWETEVGENGARLSGGQAQRVALARAVLKDSSIWLLDEPTAHLDVDAASAIERATATLVADRTVLVAAHDLRSAKTADHILVLDHGRIVQSGTHHDLLAQGGVYGRLYHPLGKEDAG